MDKAIQAEVRIILPDIGAFDPMPQTKHPGNAPQLLSSLTTAHLPARRADAHKGDFGNVLVVGGDLGTGGAVMLSAEAALRCGAGLVSVATRPEHVSAGLARLPETMWLGVSSANQLMGVLERASVLVVGPGLGQAAWGRSLLSAAANAPVPQVWDADALNQLDIGALLLLMLVAPEIRWPARLGQTDDEDFCRCEAGQEHEQEAKSQSLHRVHSLWVDRRDSP